jgi:hypothetical protein
VRRLTFLKLAVSLLLLGAVLVWGTRSGEAAHFDCLGTYMIAGYYGEEVECQGSYPASFCQAGCQYCFNTKCAQPLDVRYCSEGAHIAVQCSNEIIQ